MLFDLPDKSIEKADINEFCWGVDVSEEGADNRKRWRITYCVLRKSDKVVIKTQYFYIYSLELLTHLYEYIKELQESGILILIDKHK